MKKISTILALTFVLLATVSCKKEGAADAATEGKDTLSKAETQKIVSLNSAITEIVAALGHEKDIVGVDVTSTYPESVKKTAKDLGHNKGVTIESIVALKPTVVLGTAKDISPELAEKLKAGGIKVAIFTQEFTVEGAKKLIADVAGALNHTDFKALQDNIDADLKNVAPIAKAPKVLFVYARGANMMLVLGTGTAEDAVIKLAGGVNAADFPEGKPLTPEALIAGNPDVIVFYETGLESVGGVAGALKIPGIDKTNAGKNKKIVGIDGGLVHGFGPRVGKAAVTLNGLLSANAK